MALRLLEGFVKIFADTSDFKKSVDGLSAEMRIAGTKAQREFSKGFVTPRRVESSGNITTLRGAEPTPSLFSPFSSAAKSVRSFKANEFNIGPELERSAGGAQAFARGGIAAERAAVRLASGLRIVSGGASTTSLQILNLVRGFGVLGPAGLAVGAAIVAATVTFGPFIARANAAIDSTVKLAQAQSKADFQAFNQIIEANADALLVYQERAKFALSETEGFQGSAERLIGTFSILKNAVAEFFGGGIQASAEETRKAAAQAANLFQVLEKPKLEAQALRDAAGLMEREAGFARQAAEGVGDLEAATRTLISAKKDQATAEQALIDAEIKRFQIDRTRTPERAAELDAKIEAAQQRRLNIDRAFALEQRQILKDTARAQAEVRAKEEEAIGRELGFRRRRTDAILSASREILEVEAATNLSLDQAFRARTQLQESQTAQQVRAIQEEAAARRAAIGERLRGAVGDERVQLERELTDVTREESAKRLEVESQALAQRTQLAARERQERIGQAEQVFSIQRSLGERRLSEELRVQAQIAQAAREGSNVQISAIQRVAEIQGQIQQQARGVIQQALSVAQQAAQRLGLSGPTFVSQASLQRNLERQQARDAAVRQRFEAGGSVRAEELQSAVGNQPFFEQFKGLGGQLGDVFKQAVTPLRDAFESTLGPAVTDQFAKLADTAKSAFADLVTNATPAFQGLEKLVGDTMDRIVTRIQEGNSVIVTNITRMVEDNLTRALRDAERRS